MNHLGDPFHIPNFSPCTKLGQLFGLTLISHHNIHRSFPHTPKLGQLYGLTYVHKIYLQEKIVRSNIHKVVSISTNFFSHILHVFHQSIIKHACISVEKGKVKHINMILKLGFRICDIPIFRK